MTGEMNLAKLVEGMDPLLHEGDYVFASVQDPEEINRKDILCEFREAEGTSLVLKREMADKLQLNYGFISSWITLRIHSSLEAVGFIAFVSNELAQNNIPCNVIAGYHHDHLFVPKGQAHQAMQVLSELSKNPSV